jgi:hypothetical protein
MWGHGVRVGSERVYQRGAQHSAIRRSAVLFSYLFVCNRVKENPVSYGTHLMNMDGLQMGNLGISQVTYGTCGSRQVPC